MSIKHKSLTVRKKMVDSTLSLSAYQPCASPPSQTALVSRDTVVQNREDILGREG